MFVTSTKQNTKNSQETEYITKIDSDNLRSGAVRKYMNGAVLVQSSEETLVSDKNSLTDCQSSISNVSLPKRISCTCNSQKTCSLHESDKTLRNNHQMATATSHTHEEVKFEQNNDSEGTEFEPTIAETRESRGKGSRFEDWITKKDKEKKHFEITKLQIIEKEEKEKEKRLEQERENFKRWLLNKKKEEERLKKEQKKKAQSLKAEAEDKERRNSECSLRYQLWMKQKEQKHLEKKIKQQLVIEKSEKEKQERIENNQNAYAAWLKNSVNKPKPIPSGLGLDSLRSSLSVTYINPVPWSTNFEDEQKSRLQ